jgi:hypothetical protein
MRLSKYILGIGLVLSLVLNGCHKSDVVTTTQWEHVTIFSTFPGHQIKGRGVFMGSERGYTSIYTAKHVVKMYPGEVKIEVIDLLGQHSKGTIEYLFNCSDTAIVSIKGTYSTYEGPTISKVTADEEVFAFNYDEKSDFNDYRIPLIVNRGQVLTGPEMTPGMWEPTTLVEYANYRDHHGMSGEGVFDIHGKLVGIHSAVSMDGFAVFVPLVEAFAAEEKDGWKGDRDDKSNCQ